VPLLERLPNDMAPRAVPVWWMVPALVTLPLNVKVPLAVVMLPASVTTPLKVILPEVVVVILPYW